MAMYTTDQVNPTEHFEAMKSKTYFYPVITQLLQFRASRKNLSSTTIKHSIPGILSDLKQLIHNQQLDTSFSSIQYY